MRACGTNFDRVSGKTADGVRPSGSTPANQNANAAGQADLRGAKSGFPRREAETPARILIVEEDAESRAAMDLLLGARWDVRVVERGDAAWRAARERSHDLVIASVRLPGMSGIELTRRLRHDRHTQDVALILTSRSAQQAETLAGLEAGADDFLVKPFSGRELLARVNTRLELTAMRRRNVQQEEALAEPTAQPEVARRVPVGRLARAAHAAHDAEPPDATASWSLGDKLEERLQRRLAAIRRQVERLNQLVEQLLDVSRLVEGRMSLQPETVDLGAVVKESVELLRDSASPGWFTGVGADRAAAPSASWDRVRVGQVVTNLLSNAIKFGRGCPIEVAVEGDDMNAHLRVTDGGEGIPPPEQARIFDRFERATSVRHHPGLGLGLWICKQIVEASRGTISVAQPGREGDRPSASICPDTPDGGSARATTPELQVCRGSQCRRWAKLVLPEPIRIRTAQTTPRTPRAIRASGSPRCSRPEARSGTTAAGMIAKMRVKM